MFGFTTNSLRVHERREKTPAVPDPSFSAVATNTGREETSATETAVAAAAAAKSLFICQRGKHQLESTMKDNPVLSKLRYMQLVAPTRNNPKK